MATQVVVMTDSLLENYSSSTVQLFLNYCDKEQYDITNIEEDIEESQDSIIYEYMQCKLKWNDQETNQFIDCLQSILKQQKFTNSYCLRLNSQKINNQNQTELLQQINTKNHLLVFGFVRDHLLLYDDMIIPIPIINYLIIYSFELNTFELNCIVNNDIMLSSFDKAIINTFYNFCKEQEYFDKADILEDIKEFDDSFIVEHMEIKCKWDKNQCLSFVNLLSFVITGDNKHSKNKSYAIPQKLFNMMMRNIE